MKKVSVSKWLIGALVVFCVMFMFVACSNDNKSNNGNDSSKNPSALIGIWRSGYYSERGGYWEDYVALNSDGTGTWIDRFTCDTGDIFETIDDLSWYVEGSRLRLGWFMDEVECAEDQEYWKRYDRNAYYNNGICYTCFPYSVSSNSLYVGIYEEEWGGGITFTRYNGDLPTTTTRSVSENKSLRLKERMLRSR